jgi:hypothetical protein
MHRTAKLVLGLSLSFGMTAIASQPLLALTRSPASLTSMSSHGRRHLVKPAPRHTAGRAARPLAAHRPERSAGYTPSGALNHKQPSSRARRFAGAARHARVHHPAIPASVATGARVKPLTVKASLAGRAVAAAGAMAIPRAASLSRIHLAMPPPLRGSLDSLQRQNEKAEAEGLERIEDEDDLADRIARKLLVPVPISAALSINGNLPENHRYCRPWAASFLADLAHAHAAQFHMPLEVSSAVRTVAYQKHLMRVNGNAAPAEGDVVSPHLTGSTIDIAKSGLGRQQIGWIRTWLTPLQLAGKIDVEEEFRQACFHITVYKNYLPALPAGSLAGANGLRPAGEPAADAPAAVEPERRPKFAPTS